MRFAAQDGWDAESVIVDGVERLRDVVWLDPRTHEVCLLDKNEAGQIVAENGKVKTQVVVAKRLKIVGLHKRGEKWSKLTAAAGKWC